MPWAAKTFRQHGSPDESPSQRRSPASKAAAALINSWAWRKASKAFLALNPMCVECHKKGRDRLAYQVDHVIPHRGNTDIFWDESNWQPLCASCGGAKSARGE
jgi:5-methylcytosine-specific restriction enzyme A